MQRQNNERHSMTTPPTSGQFAEEFGEKLMELAPELAATMDRKPSTEPRYTLAEAIDKIVDGLRLEWLRPHPSESYVDESYVDAESFDGWYRSTPDAAYFRRSHECSWTVIQESLGGESNKAACLADYKTRFRAEIERAVKS